MATKTMEVRDKSHRRATDSPLSAYGKARSTVQGAPLSADALRKTHAYWRACNYLSSWHDLSAGQSPAEGTPQAGAHQEPAPRTLGSQPRSVVCLHSPEPADQEIRPEHDLPRRARPRCSRRSRRRSTSRAPTPRSTPTRAKIPTDCGSSSSSFPFLAASVVTALPKRLARFMKAANSGMCSLTPAALRSTIPT